MNRKCWDCGACLFLPPCKELGRDWTVSEEHLQQYACSLFQVQMLVRFHFDRTKGQREGCLVPNSQFNFSDLLTTLEFPWAWSSFCLTRGVLLDLSVSGRDCLFMSTFTQGLHFPFCATKSAKADTQTMHGQAKSPGRAVTWCQPCSGAGTWPWAILGPPWLL